MSINDFFDCKAKELSNYKSFIDFVEKHHRGKISVLVKVWATEYAKIQTDKAVERVKSLNKTAW